MPPAKKSKQPDASPASGASVPASAEISAPSAPAKKAGKVRVQLDPQIVSEEYVEPPPELLVEPPDSEEDDSDGAEIIEDEDEELLEQVTEPARKAGKVRVQLDPQIVSDEYVEPPPELLVEPPDFEEDDSEGAESFEDVEEEPRERTAEPVRKAGKVRVQLDPQIVSPHYVEPSGHSSGGNARGAPTPGGKVRIPDPFAARERSRIQIPPPAGKVRMSADGRPIPSGRTFAPMRRRDEGNEVLPPGAAKRVPATTAPKLRIPSPDGVPGAREVPTRKTPSAAPRREENDVGTLVQEAIKLISRAATRAPTAEGRAALALLRASMRELLDDLNT